MIERLSTKALLDLSCIELLSSGSLDKLTVKDICANCKLSTRTFYKYYNDKYDITNSCFRDQITEHFKHNEIHTLHDFILFTNNFFYDNINFFKNVFKYTGQNNIRLAVVAPIRNQYIRLIEENYHVRITDSQYDAITFFIRGSLAFVEESIISSDIPDAEYATRLYENAIPACLEQFLYR